MCKADVQWEWEEAFDKFGFMDGDGLVETQTVADVLTDAGYEVVVEEWGMHNTIITEIKKQGRSQIRKKAIVGYDDPRGYLPKRLIKLLDKEFPPDGPFNP